MSHKPSDLLASHAAVHDVEFLLWWRAALDLWIGDPRLDMEFISVTDFFNWAFLVSEDLIRSAFKK